jgi:hypothetical protein
MGSSEDRKGFWINRNPVSRCIFVLIVAYCVSVIAVLSMTFGIVPVEWAYFNPYLLMGFAVASFFLTVLISAYHLGNLFRRRKRKTDK